VTVRTAGKDAGSAVVGVLRVVTGDANDDGGGESSVARFLLDDVGVANVSVGQERVRGDSVRIRIRPPYGFWALNSFAIAYGTAGDVRVTILNAATARTSDGRDVLPELSADDDRYYSMPSNSDYGFVTFRAPPVVQGSVRSVFAHTRGYYRLHLDPVNPPDSATLASFLAVPDAAANFAAARYMQLHPRVASAH